MQTTTLPASEGVLSSPSIEFGQGIGVDVAGPVNAPTCISEQCSTTQTSPSDTLSETVKEQADSPSTLATSAETAHADERQAQDTQLPSRDTDQPLQNIQPELQWNSLPSVDTWAQNTQLPSPNTDQPLQNFQPEMQWNLLPSVGTWAMNAPDNEEPGESARPQVLESVDFHIGQEPFDPTLPETSTSLLTLLGCGDDDWKIDKLPGFQGGMNDGVWIAEATSSAPDRDKDRALALKLVNGKRKHRCLPTEAEILIDFAERFPSIRDDTMLTFPTKIVHCLGEEEEKRYDLLVMRRAQGERLAEIIALKWHMGQKPELFEIIERVGARTAEFHMRYGGVQHGDLQPSNIFWSQSEGCVTFIDVGGIGQSTEDNDIQHFLTSVHILAGFYGAEFELEITRAFLGGYCNMLIERSEGEEDSSAASSSLQKALCEAVDAAENKFAPAW